MASYSIIQRLLKESDKSTQISKHACAAMLGKKIICLKHNSRRSRYHIGDRTEHNCSYHAEMAVLAELIRRYHGKSNKRKKVA
jgi:hypothetical protein